MHSRILKTASFAFASVVAGSCFAQTASTAPTVQTAPAPDIKLDTSVVYARGSYGLPTDTDIWIALVNPTYETNDWRLQASLPWIWLKGPASVVGNAGTAPAARTESGVGDAAVTVTRKFDPGASGWYTSFGVKVKLPTADDKKGLGTGQADAALQFDVTKKFGEITPYATAGYQFLGRSALYPMKDGFFGTLGLISMVSDETSMGLAGNWRQPTISGGSSASELMAFAQQKITDSSHFQVFVLHGFTDASPSFAIGATFGWKF